MGSIFNLYSVFVVSLTKTDRKGLAWKQRIIDDIRFCVEKYPNIFVFQVQNMRNNLLKDLRQEWKRNSRFIFGKLKIEKLLHCINCRCTRVYCIVFQSLKVL